MRRATHLSALILVIALAQASTIHQITPGSFSRPTAAKPPSSAFLISLLRQPKQASSACPNSPGICDPATSVCCPGSNLCCPTELPFCLQPPIINQCADADGKTLCGADADGAPIKGTICLTQSDICCPDPDYPFCTRDAPGACVDDNGFVSCGIANPLPGVDCGGGACCQDPQRCCVKNGAPNCCDPDEPDVFGGPRNKENFGFTTVEGATPGVIIPAPPALPGEIVSPEPTPSSSPGASPILSLEPVPSPAEPSPVQLPEDVSPAPAASPVQLPETTAPVPSEPVDPSDGATGEPGDTDGMTDEVPKEIDPPTTTAPGQTEGAVTPVVTDPTPTESEDGEEGEEPVETDEEITPSTGPIPSPTVVLPPEEVDPDLETVGPMPTPSVTDVAIDDDLIPTTSPESEPTAEVDSDDDDDEDDGSVCWPASATVELESGERVQMMDVQVGMRVRVAGGNSFSEVFGWTHKDEGYRGRRFVRVGMEGGRSVVASVGHMMYRRRCEARVCDRELVEIEKMEKGDEMWMVEEGREVVKTVERVGRVRSHGLFNPQTVHGDIVVDDVVATCYTKYVPHKVAHGLLAPIRALYEWTGLGFCVSV